jgi:hypothetical protein
MTTTQATPRPWALDKKRSLCVTDTNGRTVATTGTSDLLRQEWEANAELIVRAVNEYAVVSLGTNGAYGDDTYMEIVYALEDCFEIVETANGCEKILRKEKFNEIVDRYRTALALARGQQ